MEQEEEGEKKKTKQTIVLMTRAGNAFGRFFSSIVSSGVLPSTGKRIDYEESKYVEYPKNSEFLNYLIDDEDYTEEFNCSGKKTKPMKVVSLTTEEDIPNEIVIHKLFENMISLKDEPAILKISLFDFKITNGFKANLIVDDKTTILDSSLNGKEVVLWKFKNGFFTDYDVVNACGKECVMESLKQCENLERDLKYKKKNSNNVFFPYNGGVKIHADSFIGKFLINHMYNPLRGGEREIPIFAVPKERKNVVVRSNNDYEIDPHYLSIDVDCFSDLIENLKKLFESIVYFGKEPTLKFVEFKGEGKGKMSFLLRLSMCYKKEELDKKEFLMKI